MKCVLFYHSITSCWNHGNAHFLRGIARELIRLGHAVTVYEPEHGWSRTNALRDRGESVLTEAEALVPGVEIVGYRGDMPDLDLALDRADLVIAHEWNAPALIAALSARRIAGGEFLLLFHDTHHRAVSAAEEFARFEIDGFDAVLAFGEALREIYVKRGWGRRAFTWHEAADTALFYPLPRREPDTDLIWIGNWGDEERTHELRRFLIEPAARLGITARIHGVRYPADARTLLSENGLEFAGWLPNHRVPQAFAGARLTLHVPRRAYVEALPGIPTIRMFEALACGIPLICAPWSDCEGLFPRGSYLLARDGEAMEEAISRVLRDRDLAETMTEEGLNAIAAHHSCAHRVSELLAIVDTLQVPGKAPAAARRPRDLASAQGVMP